MGSLMAGWSSQVLADERKVRMMRNRSLTKEDVEAFWRQQQQRKPAEDGGGGETDTSPPLASSPRVESPRTSSLLSSSALSRVQSSPPAICVDGDGADGADSPSTSRDWWTRSSWAFLNEPPREEALRRIVTGNA